MAGQSHGCEGLKTHLTVNKQQQKNSKRPLSNSPGSSPETNAKKKNKKLRQKLKKQAERDAILNRTIVQVNEEDVDSEESSEESLENMEIDEQSDDREAEKLLERQMEQNIDAAEELIKRIRSGMRTKDNKEGIETLSDLQSCFTRILTRYHRVLTKYAMKCDEVKRLIKYKKSEGNEKVRPESFAAVAQKRIISTKETKRLNIKKKSLSVVIRPKDKEKYKDMEQVKQDLQAAFSPGKNKARISKVIKRKDEILIESDSLETIQLLKDNPKIKKKFEVAETQKWRPRIIIYDVPIKVDDEKLINKVHQQNGIEMDMEKFKADFVPKFRTGKKERDVSNRVIMVSPEIRTQLIQKRSLCIGWVSCRVLDYTMITRCYKCQGFWHIHTSCKAKELCSHCAEEGHDFRKCPKSEQAKKCANCKKAGKPADHNVMDKNCPCRRKALERMVNNTDWHDGDD